MTKKEMLTDIAKAYYPKKYENNNVLQEAFIKTNMKLRKTELDVIYNYAIKVLKERG